MNKFIKYLTIGLFAMSVLFACSESNTGFSDPDTTVFNKEIVFKDSLMSFEFVAGIYAQMVDINYFLDNGIYSGSCWMWDDASNNSHQVYTGSAQMSYRWTTNTVTSTDARTKRHWTIPYSCIFRVNTVLNNIEKTPISSSIQERLKAEVRFIRAYQYYHLLRCFGGTPIYGDMEVGPSSDLKVFSRATFEEQVDYIVKECTEIARILPPDYESKDYGRATSGAALALKARVLLYAASQLNNNNNLPAGVTQWPAELVPVLKYPNYDKERWKKAVDAAKAVIDLNRYSLVVDNTTRPGNGFYTMQITRKNSEIIFPLLKNNNSRYPANCFLPKSTGGSPQSWPIQNLVDAFLMKDGKRIDDKNSKYNYAVETMYENRDPRFYYTILYDGAMWRQSSSSATKVRLNMSAASTTTDKFEWGANNNKTGYLWRKFCSEDMAGNGPGYTDWGFPFIRFAEMYLAYAEALNEYYGPGSHRNEIQEQIIKIRERAGIDPGDNGLYGIPAGWTQEQMRDLIFNERRIEFAAEEAIHYFDMKRCNLLVKYKSEVPIKIAQWNKPYPTTDVEFIIPYNARFDPGRQYFFPIPPGEIDKVGKSLIQNPGW
ncbi:MAG: RagB/SusD family nutrient uptake outer membrane protein [Dysgonamonadaceae bacterium]|jgi:hypothetical protein|nr:RagB/SusD family nutrient uptake outer membrane protein [Dysgonamonadaceae bacterium]